MGFAPLHFTRTGEITTQAGIADVFPLLCPKREEQWIPGWECETIWSRSGYNEEGAIFRTTAPYGTELYWTTLRYDIADKVVDFLITAPHRFMFRFRIDIGTAPDGLLTLTFTQTFTAVSEEGNKLVHLYTTEDFAGRLKKLEEFLQQHLQRP